MATKLYFHAAASSVSGTLPATFQGTWNVNSIEDSNRSMSTIIGTSQTSITENTIGATTANRTQRMARFVSDTLNSAQTVGGGSIILNCADTESNTNANFWINNVYIYVWRPSTGTQVGVVRGSSTTAGGFGGTETTSASQEQVTHITGITSSAVSASAGDVIIVEVGSAYTQSMSSVYTGTFYFDGTTENTTENAVVSNHASYIQFTENLTFGAISTPTSYGYIIGG